MPAMNSPLLEVIRLFLKLGTVSFGGPAGHVALMEQEVVHKRGWLSREHFLDLLAATNLVPGPNATEMAIHIGYVRAGWPGLVAAGVAFILPAFLISLAIAVAYVRFRAMPQANAILYGITPVVVAIIITATYRLGRSAIKSRTTLALFLVSLLAVALGVNEVAILLVMGVAGVVLGMPRASWPFRLAAAACPLVVATGRQLAHSSGTVVDLLLYFLKVGSLIFGSGMVLFAFIQRDVVSGYGWLSQQQLLDAIAVGQMTPGPVLSSATFIGYVVAGVPGAIAATAGVFAPSFVITALIGPWIPRLRRSPLAQSFLRGVTAVVVALMLAVAFVLLRSAITDAFTIGILAVAMVALLRFRIDAMWLVGGGALVGLARYLVV
ncbi:MAG: chromate efflux transporter [Anaerolineae bacterium]